jgi:hypothetical protein
MGMNNPAGTVGVQELNEPVSALPLSQVIKVYHTEYKHMVFTYMKKKIKWKRMQEIISIPAIWWKLKPYHSINSSAHCQQHNEGIIANLKPTELR